MAKKKTPDFVELKERIGFGDQAQILEDSALFKMALGAKELFHSNFMKWLNDKHRCVLEGVLNQYYPDETVVIEALYREKSHLDVQIKARVDGKVLRIAIENKVKSLPSKSQLSRYSEKKFGKKARYILLTMTPALFSTSWDELRYARYLEFLAHSVEEHKKNIDVYDLALLNDYIQFTKALTEIVSFFEASGRYLYTPDERSMLDHLRIKDLVGKMSAYSMAMRLQERIKGEHGLESELVFGGSKWQQTCPTPVEIEVNYSQGTPICSVFYHFDENYFMGIQLDELEERVSFREPRVPAKHAATLLAPHLTQWFTADFEEVKEPIAGGRVNCHRFGEYKDNSKHLFLYKRRHGLKGGTVSVEVVADIIMAHFDRLLALRSQVKDQIEQHEKACSSWLGKS